MNEQGMSAQLSCRVRGYGPLGDLLSGEQPMVLAPVSTVGHLRSELIRARPELEAFTFRIAIDHTLLDESDTVELRDGMEIALFPPFAGG